MSWELLNKNRNIREYENSKTIDGVIVNNKGKITLHISNVGSGMSNFNVGYQRGDEKLNPTEIMKQIDAGDYSKLSENFMFGENDYDSEEVHHELQIWRKR